MYESTADRLDYHMSIILIRIKLEKLSFINFAIKLYDIPISRNRIPHKNIFLCNMIVIVPD